MVEPLLRWTRPLSAQERDADIKSDLGLAKAFRASPATAASERRTPDWMPVLPHGVPQCRICTLPNRNGLCSPCSKLLRHHGFPVDTLEFLAIVDKRTPPEQLMWSWKETATTARGVAPASDEWLRPIAACLSAYVEAHADRLLAGSPFVTAIPSRAPVIARSFSLAAERDWFALNVGISGSKNGDWYQHTMPGQRERLARTVDDWALISDLPAGRCVLLFDDVFVSGASMFSSPLP